MKWIAGVFAALISLFGCGAKPASAAKVTTCSAQQLLGATPSQVKIADHRRFDLPVIRYPFGTEFKSDAWRWGFPLTLRVDAAGKVVCYELKDDFDRKLELNDARSAIIQGMLSRRYTPFLSEGKPAPAIVKEYVREEELPQKHIPLPDVPLADVHIGLQRTGCFGSCPSYKVDVFGDGRVVYEGDGFVDVEGRHAYRIPTSSVAGLVDSLRAKDLWSLRSSYNAAITDNPTYLLTLDIGGQSHRIEDYVGQWVGMPAAVSEFEDEVDKISGAGDFVNLSRAGVARLEAEGFDFDSPVAGDVLARAAGNEDTSDDAAMLRLIQLGAPLTRSDAKKAGFYQAPRPLIEEALRHQRAALIGPLIERGVLKTQGKPDQDKLDAAFRAAIEGGRLALVERVWNVYGPDLRPRLTFDDVSEDEQKRHQRSPVTLLIDPYAYQERHREGMAITRWLAARGCDIKAHGANGVTVLHIAADAGDVEWVRYLLDQGVDPSTPGEFGLPALGSTDDEDIAMMLLQAGSRLQGMDEPGDRFKDYAIDRHWARVLEWLAVHRQDEK